ncbi:hypothetical protein RND81_06G097700 [Saponaria officinalis]|uniref:Uncharacterized protein n=1 Tax=Saponaria officinalis TaxID=3572 RepID=A0AAW1KBT7_SAPOF
MEEEFHESDVIFSEICQLPNTSKKNTLDTNHSINSKKHRKNTTITKSIPLDIPDRNTTRYVDVVECEDDEDGYEDIERRKLPPHLIIARRIKNVSNQMACSYCLEDGRGRILKGRNLFQIRNSILRLTGFIET